MMSFRKISADSNGAAIARYFTEGQPDPSHDFRRDGSMVPDADGKRLSSYYLGRAARASFNPEMSQRMAEALGVDRFAPPSAETLARLFEAKRADNGEAWSKHDRKISAYDLTLAPHKSVTLAAEFAPTQAESAAIVHAVQNANDATMRYVAQELGYARRGHGGEDGADPGEVAWVSFRHHSARPTISLQDAANNATYLMDSPTVGDPHLHIHNSLYNMVLTEDGHIGSLDTKRLRSRVHEFGAYYQAVLADELRKLGIAQSYDANEQATVITAIPQDVSDAFSSRTSEVVRAAKAYAKEAGKDWQTLPADAKNRMMKAASLAHRQKKNESDNEAEAWRQRAETLGWTHASVLDQAEPTAGPDEARFDAAYRFAAKYLSKEFETAAVIDHDKLRVYAARGLIGTGIAGGTADIDQVVSLIETRGLDMGGEHVALIAVDRGDKIRVTNSAQIRIEETLVADAARASQDRGGALSDQQITDAIARSHLNFDTEHGRVQKAAMFTLGKGSALSMLTGVAGSGKTALLSPLVDAWTRDTRYSPDGRHIIGLATAWRQADALRDAGIEDTRAMMPFLQQIQEGKVAVDRNTVIVVDEVGQVSPRQMLRLLDLQRETGLTLKLLGDREQAQSIEAGDALEILKRVLDPHDKAQLLSTIRQSTARDRTIAGLFRGGEPDEAALEQFAPKGKQAFASTDADNDDDVRNKFHAAEVRQAIDMKRADGTIRLLSGDHDEVLAATARIYVERRDALLAQGPDRKGRYKTISMTALTNDDAADLSRAVRSILQERGEISKHEIRVEAVDQRGETYDLSIAQGDRLRLFRRTWGHADGKGVTVGNNGDVVEVVAHGDKGLRVRNRQGVEADVQWQRLRDPKTGRVMLGFGHAMTVDAAQGITSDEHINAMPKGSDLATGFTSYVAESRARGTTWTLISDGATFEAVRNKRAMGDLTEITSDDLWDHVARNMAHKPYKALGMDLPHRTRKERDARVRDLIALGRRHEELRQGGRDYGAELRHQVEAAAVNKRPNRLAEIDAQISVMLREATFVMPESERALRRERVAQVRSGARPGGGPGPSGSV